MAEYLVVKPHNLVKLDTLDPVDAAPLADAALTPMHAINGCGRASPETPPSS